MVTMEKRKTSTCKDELAKTISALNDRVLVSEARTWIDMVFDAIKMKLLMGENIRIKNFGTFQRRKHRAMNGYNPYTGGRIEIDERHSVAFVPAKDFKSRLNG